MHYGFCLLILIIFFSPLISKQYFENDYQYYSINKYVDFNIFHSKYVPVDSILKLSFYTEPFIIR